MGILSDIVNEDKVEMCPEACCGKPITECKCGPDCEHCDCHSKNSAINEGTMIGGLMKYDGQPEGEYADAVAKYKEFMSKPRPPGEATNTMVQGFVFDDDLLDNLGDAEEHGDILDVRFIVQSRLEDFFGDDFELSEGTQGCADCEWIKDETDGDIDTCDDCAAEKRQTNEAEKRWKQTSMSPQEAIAKYGKENVKVKKGALRNGDDMVEVFVESMNEGGNSVEAFMSHVVDHAKEIQADNYRMTDSSYYEFTDEIDTDDEEFMSMPQVQAILKAIPHVDMENTDIKHAIDILASGELLEAETESYSPGDEMEDGVVSNCCGAPLMDYNDGHGRCSDCKEMAAGETDEEYYEADDKLPEPEFQLMKKSLLRSKWYLENEEMDPEMVATELRDVNAMLDAVNRSESEAPLDLDTSVEEEYMSLYNQCVAKLRGAGSNIYGVDHDVLPLDAKPNPDSPYNSGQVEENILPVSEFDNELQRIQDLVKFR